ncbi:MAG: serine/threonine-protein kinase [Anaerolineales bacterium]|jgi:serine/threonine-protein kinase
MNDLPTLGGRYQLVGLVGSEATADHYRALDLPSGALVAVKVLREELTHGPQFRRKFLTETQALARLSHPNLVSLLDFGIEGSWCFLVLELVEGVDLKRHLFQQGQLSVNESLSIARQISAGLGLAHSAGLVHGDVRPHNVLLAASGLAKLADLGVARLFSSRDHLPQDELWATPQYFSPEQAAGEDPSPSSDVYSLGVVLFEMLAGRLPFRGQDLRDLTLEELIHAPPSLGALVPSSPRSVEAVLDRMLEKNPQDRYRDGNEAAAALSVLAPDLGVEPLPATTARAAGPTGDARPEKSLMAKCGEGRIDWKAVGLGFLALVAVGGLFPLWVWVYLVYHPPAP